MTPQTDPPHVPKEITEFFSLTQGDWLEGPIHVTTAPFRVDELRDLREYMRRVYFEHNQQMYYATFADSKSPALYQILHGRFAYGTIAHNRQVVDIRFAYALKARDAEAAAFDFAEMRKTGSEWDTDDATTYKLDVLELVYRTDDLDTVDDKATAAHFMNTYFDEDSMLVAMRVIRYQRTPSESESAHISHAGNAALYKEFLFYIPTNSS